MAGARRRYDPDFRADAIRIVTETGKSRAEMPGILEADETTLATWVSREQTAQRQAQASRLGELEAAPPARLRRERADFRMELRGNGTVAMTFSATIGAFAPRRPPFCRDRVYLRSARASWQPGFHR